MHTIFHFESKEVRSPTFQTVHKLELKRRSYGRLKTTASSCAKRNPLAKFCKVFRSCETTCKHMCATSQVETPSSQLRTTLQNHLQVAKSRIQLAKSKFKLAKRTIQTCEIFASHVSTCEIHLCKLEYLQPTQLDFFSRYFV